MNGCTIEYLKVCMEVIPGSYNNEKKRDIVFPGAKAVQFSLGLASSISISLEISSG